MQTKVMTAARADVETLGKVFLIQALTAGRADLPQRITDCFRFGGSAS